MTKSPVKPISKAKELTFKGWWNWYTREDRDRKNTTCDVAMAAWIRGYHEGFSAIEKEVKAALVERDKALWKEKRAKRKGKMKTFDEWWERYESWHHRGHLKGIEYHCSNAWEASREFRTRAQMGPKRKAKKK